MILLTIERPNPDISLCLYGRRTVSQTTLPLHHHLHHHCNYKFSQAFHARTLDPQSEIPPTTAPPGSGAPNACRERVINPWLTPESNKVAQRVDRRRPRHHFTLYLLFLVDTHLVLDCYHFPRASQTQPCSGPNMHTQIPIRPRGAMACKLGRSNFDPGYDVLDTSKLSRARFHMIHSDNLIIRQTDCC